MTNGEATADRPATRGSAVETYHVVPTEDWIVHEERLDSCVCGPHFEYFRGGTVIVHHALDGRNADDPTWPRRRAGEVARSHLADEPA